VLYGLGVNATANTATLYVIGRQTGFAAVVGAAPSTIAFVQVDGTTAVDLPDGAYGVDFNRAWLLQDGLKAPAKRRFLAVAAVRRVRETWGYPRVGVISGV